MTLEMTMPADDRTTTQELSPRQYRDTEPMAVWGFVLTFLFWPVGLVLCYVALRRIRRTGAGGWGLATAGAALSTLLAVGSVLGGIRVFVDSGIPAAWAKANEEQANENRVRSVVRGLESDLVDFQEENGAWPVSVVDVDADASGGLLRGVAVEAYRTGDEVCVEGSRDGFTGSSSGGEFDEVPCAERGHPATLRAVAAREAEAVEQAAFEAAFEAALADVLRLGEEAAVESSVGEPKDLGRRWIPPIDLMACSLVAGNKGHLDDQMHEQALAVAFRERADTVADDGLDNEAYGFEEALRSADDEFSPDFDGEILLRAEFACWHGGYVGPGAAPTFPTAWTTPLTQEALDADDDRVARWDTMSEEEKAAYIAAEDAAMEVERAELEAILESYR